MGGKDPHLSFVATSRNDDHGGSLLGRMQVFVSGLLAQCGRHGLDAELVIVEWNPPPDRPRLAQALRWPSDRGQCRVRFVEVPPETHSRFAHSDALPLFQMIAKNVGIRRARAPFVLATNIDILFNDELVRFLASGRLDGNSIYRIDRHDAKHEVPVGVPVVEQLGFCRENLIRLNAREGTFAARAGKDSGRGKDTGAGLRILRRLRNPDGKLIDAIRNRWKARALPRLHCNASGDFTLMHRDLWFRLRGYPELEMHPMHLDGFTCYAAHYAGIREHVLADPMRIYHVEHEPGSGSSVAGQRKMRERLASRGIPVVTYEQFLEWALQMKKRKAPLILNSEDWGLGRESLPETSPGE